MKTCGRCGGEIEYPIIREPDYILCLKCCKDISYKPLPDKEPIQGKSKGRRL